MAKFRQKVKTITAEQWDGTEEQALKLGLVSYTVKERNASGWAIYKNGSYTFVNKSDWVITAEDGSMKAVDPKAFSKQFEPVAA